MSVDDIIARWFHAGARPRGRERIGVEIELLCFDRATLSPVTYDGDSGLGTLLGRLAGTAGWSPRHEDGLLVGLTQESVSGTSSVSIEPGCQIEFSGAPLPTLHDVAAQLQSNLGLIAGAARDTGIGLLPMGYAPAGEASRMPRSPQSRRKVMEGFLAPRGVRATETMYCTCSVQVNLDYHDEADFRAKLRVANALQPVATALFAASPFRHGRANGILSNRAQCWRFTDAERTGPLPFAFMPGFGYRDYVDYALARPMAALAGPGEAILPAPAGGDFRGYCAAEELAQAEVLRNWNVHNSFLYPQLRPKPYLELRGADCSPLAIMGVAAFWTGLLYDEAALAEGEALVADWSLAECRALTDAVPATALHTKFRGRPVQELACRAVAIASNGLARRARTSPGGPGETQYLARVAEVAESGLTLAETLARDYQQADGLAIDALLPAWELKAEGSSSRCSSFLGAEYQGTSR